MAADNGLYDYLILGKYTRQTVTDGGLQHIADSWHYQTT